MSRKLSNYKGSSQVKLKKSVSYINIGLQKYIKHLNNFFGFILKTMKSKAFCF